MSALFFFDTPKALIQFYIFKVVIGEKRGTNICMLFAEEAFKATKRKKKEEEEEGRGN